MLTQRQLTNKIKKFQSDAVELPGGLLQYVEKAIFDFYAETYPESSVSEIRKLVEGRKGKRALRLLEKSEVPEGVK